MLTNVIGIGYEYVVVTDVIEHDFIYCDGSDDYCKYLIGDGHGDLY